MPHESDAVGASHSVLIDVLTILGRYREHLVVVGGWVPELTFPDRGHIGSLDVDIAIDGHVIMNNAYTTIRNLLLQNEYRPAELPSRFTRVVKRGVVEAVVVLDLVTGDREAAATDAPRWVQEMPVSGLRGIDLAFDFPNKLELSGTLPEGGRNTVIARVCDLRAFLAMKGIVLWERKKPKDAYDAYFSIKHHGDAMALADLFKPILDQPMIQEGLRKLRAKFLTLEHVGPVWAASVASAEASDEERDQTRQDAFQRVSRLLDFLEIEPWTG